MQKRIDRNNKKQAKTVQNVSVKNATKTPQGKSIRQRVKYECNKQLAEMIQQANILPKDFHFTFDNLLENARLGVPLLSKWYELFLSLPKEITGFLVMSDEILEYEKNDAREFWIYNDGYAQDKLIDLNADNQISDEEFNNIINEGSDEIADFLIEYGYYGEDYSYVKQVKQKKKDSFSILSSDEDDNETSHFHELTKALTYIQALERLQSIRYFLLAIIKLAEFTQQSQIAKTESNYQFQKHNEHFAKLALQELTTKKLKDKVLATSISINKNGEVSFSVSEWANALIGVDITRIRICEVCGKIFWANRKDAFACSKKHSKVRQMRLLRNNWKKSGDLYVKARKNKSRGMEKK
jgi:hypothetical protein